jgi:lambda family phage tail tape measure protein
MFGWSGDAAKFGRDVASQVLELKQALNAGRVDVEGFGTAMAEIAARHPDFAGQAKEVANLVTKYREAADAARTLAGQMAQLQGVDDTTVAAFSRGRLAVQAFTDQQTNLTKAAGFAMKDGKLIAQPLVEIAGYEATLADINKALAGSFTVNGQAVKFTTDQLAELARVSPLVEQALQRLREKSDPVAQAVKNLGQEAASMAVPAGVERERVKARQGVENALGMPAADTSAIDSAVSAVALARLRDTTRETGQAAAGQRLLAAAAGGNALAQAEAARTVELYNEALRTYGATVAAAVLAGKPLPSDLAALGRALEQVDLAKFAAEAARVGKEAQLEAEASGRLAEAWRTGSIAAIEAAGRENELAKLLERVPGHAKAAAESIDLLRAARRNLAAGQFLGQLQAEIDALERLGQARRLGEAAAREAQAKEDANRVIRDPSAPIVDPAVAAAMQAQAVAKANAAAAWEAENRVLQSLHSNREQALQDMEAIKRLYDAQAISADEFATANNQAMMRALQDNRDFASGAELAIRRYVDSASNSAAQMDTFFTNSFRSMEDAVVNWAKTGKASATELFDTIISGIIRIAAQKAVLGPMESLVGGLIGGIAKSIGAAIGGGGEGSSGGGSVPVPDTGNYAVVHVGGIAGHGTGITRQIDPAVFAGAPRFHTGKDPRLMPGEVPAILKDDEEVLTRQDPRHRWNGNAANSNGGGNGRTVVNVTAPPGTTQDQVQQKRSTGSSGEEIIDIIIGEKVDKMTREGRFDAANRDTYGVTRRPVRRS